MLVCAIDLIINEDQEPMNSSLITSDESMVISPNATIDESWTTRKNKSRTDVVENWGSVTSQLQFTKT